MRSNSLKMPNYGGQALIEGVLMRGKRWCSAAYRLPDGKIFVEEEKLSGLYLSPLSKLPFFRGLLLLWDALGLGMRFLTRSANYQSDENQKIKGSTLTLTAISSLLIFLIVFFLLPAFIGKSLGEYWNFSSLSINIFEGLIRFIFLLLYIMLVGKDKDVARVFSYHGAEHKTINAFENGVDLSIQSIQQFSLYHPRCGTGFILTVAVLSMIIFIFFGSLSWYWLIITRIILIPIIIMVSYEYIRLLSNNISNPIVKVLLWPNMKMQRLTTNEPDPSMIEVAYTAFSRMKELEEKYD